MAERSAQTPRTPSGLFLNCGVLKTPAKAVRGYSIGFGFSSSALALTKPYLA